VDPDPGGQKRPTKIEKGKKFHAGCPLLRAEGFFCILDVLYEGLGLLGIDTVIIIFDQKNIKYFFQLYIFSIFGHQNPGSGLNLDPDRY
jgi:hypothetical protein